MDIGEKVKTYLDKGVSASKNAIDKGVEVSRKAFDKAGVAVQDFSDKSVLRIEKHQFEIKREEQLKKLGKLAADKFIGENQTTLSAEETELQGVLREIRQLDEEIGKREAVLSDGK
jgi:DNA-directed RNA polymerase specialized sigma54-like protein